jgi:hypothetical protein
VFALGLIFVDRASSQFPDDFQKTDPRGVDGV